MSSSSWTIEDACRDALALVVAYLEGDSKAADAIFAAQGYDGLRLRYLAAALMILAAERQDAHHLRRDLAEG